MKKITMLLLLSAFAMHTQAQKTQLKRLEVEFYDAATQSYILGDSVEYYTDASRSSIMGPRLFMRRDVPIRSRRYKADSPFEIDFTRWSGPHTSNDLGFHYDSAIMYRRNVNPNAVFSKAYQTFDPQVGWVSTYRLETIVFNQQPNMFRTYRRRTNQYTQPIKLYRDFTKDFDTFRYKHIPNTAYPDSLFITRGQPSSNIFVKFHSQGMYVNGEDEYLPYINMRTQYMYNYIPMQTDPSTKIIESAVTVRYLPATQPGDTMTRRKFVYDAQDKMIEEQMYHKNMYGNNGWRNTYKIKTAYNSLGQLIADTTYYDYYINGSAHPRSNAGLKKRALREYQYDGNGNIVHYEVRYWDDSSQAWGGGVDSLFGPAQRVQLYYTNPTTSIANTVQEDAQLQLYPVPANNEVTIETMLSTKSSFEVSIVNINGAVVKQWKEPASKQYTKTISTADMAPGTYIVKLSNDDIAITKRLVIIR